MRKNKTVGYGFVGRWRDESIGWCLPEFLHGSNVRGNVERSSERFNAYARDSERAVLCKITLEVVKDSRGREIRRKPRR